MLNRLVLAASLVAATGFSTTHAIWEVAEGEVFLTGSVGVSHDSNITGSSLEVSDTVYSITPGATFERSRGRGSINLSASSTISRYQEFDEQDSENYQGSLAIDMPATPAGRLHGSFKAAYFEGSAIDDFLADRIKTRSYDFSLSARYQATNKISTRLGTSYDNNDPEDSPSYSSKSLTLGAGYNFRPALSTYLDVRFSESSGRDSGLFGRTKTTSESFLVGLDGEITSKLSGNIGVGIQQSETRSFGTERDNSSGTYDVGLTWTPRQRTSVSLNGSSSTRVTSTGEAARRYNMRLSVNQQVGTRVTATAGLLHSSSKFESISGRNDDVFGFTLDGSYALGKHVSFGAGVSFTQTDSSVAQNDYDRTVWRLSASARF